MIGKWVLLLFRMRLERFLKLRWENEAKQAVSCPLSRTYSNPQKIYAYLTKTKINVARAVKQGFILWLFLSSKQYGILIEKIQIA